MKFNTFSEWDETLWAQAAAIYEPAFAGKGAKPAKVIRNMFRNKICFLHLGTEDGKAVAMALTGELHGIGALVLDYLAVHQDLQHRGIGQEMIKYIKDWALNDQHFNGLVIEVEADENPENRARIHFWEKCGFTLTDYIHHYIWVPEPYRAMYLHMVPDTKLPKNGQELFHYISLFHKASFQGA